MNKHKCQLLGCLVAFSVLLISGVRTAESVSLEEKLRMDPDLSQFYALLEANKYANVSMQYRALTLFAPTNQAFQRYSGRRTDVLYHMINQPLTIDQLAVQSHSVATEMDGSTPLWITIRHGTHSNEIYINNAKIIRGKSDFHTKNADGKQQVLHVIDDVLLPVMPSQTAQNPIYNPDAYTFINQSENYDMGHHRVRSFRQRIRLTQKGEIFKKEGRYTFFVPVEEGFQVSSPAPRPDKIDGIVIDGHVIPNEVLFTHSTPNERQYRTLAFGDNVRIQISFSTTQEGKKQRTTVRSNTLLGNGDIATGVVLAEVVMANIPVKNGVVHLIQRPLIIVDTNVTTFLQYFKGIDHVDGPLYQFYGLLVDQGQEFIDKLNHMRDLTLFAPSNEAINQTKNLGEDKAKLREILYLHLINERLSIEQIANKNLHTLFQVPTAAVGKTLYFNVIKTGRDDILTVEGGGVNATVIQPNIAATNGFVHIIDRVLGVPYTNVLEKLETDPMLNDTYFLGKAGRFNLQLNDTTKKFTYFVPRDKAWRDLEILHPSTHKKMFMKDFSYHATQILERHLVISDVAYTMEKMKLLANETNNHQIILPTVRDTLRIKIKDNDKNDKSFSIEWRNQWVNVFRPDVECINGIIHVIDKPFLKDSDIKVAAAAGCSMLSPMYLLPHLVMVLVAKWLIL